MTHDRMFWQIIEGLVMSTLLALISIERGWLTPSQALTLGCVALALMVVLLPCVNAMVDHFFSVDDASGSE